VRVGSVWREITRVQVNGLFECMKLPS